MGFPRKSPPQVGFRSFVGGFKGFADLWGFLLGIVGLCGVLSSFVG